ncbi:orotidine-5'-phosphate decarboxylase [bacterium]|nr:orotidine-5'-phosphate decarboxylase [bacterium]
MIEKIFAAMDFSDFETFEKEFNKISSHIELFKVGYQLFYSEAGARVMDFLDDKGKKIFLDLKMNDIPNTMLKGLTSLRKRFTFHYLTAHISSGEAAMRSLATEGRQLGVEILGVTLLTSLSADDLHSMGIDKDHSSLIRRRIESAADWGVPGVIMSAADLTAVDVPNIIKITPGIRYKEDSADDQKRVTTPAEAFANGADMLVMGRSLFKHPVEKLLKELGE